MSAHTPGPWNFACDSYGKVRHSRKACVYTVLKTDTGDRIVTVAARIENWKDVRLIAAAPELLAALKAVLGYFDSGHFVRNIDGDGSPDWAIKAFPSIRSLADGVAAIAKAEGRE